MVIVRCRRIETMRVHGETGCYVDVWNRITYI